MGLEKLKISPLSNQGKKDPLKEITVLFNPTTYSISKTVAWESPETASGKKKKTNRQTNAPALTFNGGGSRQLSLELFFDVTEPVEVNGQMKEIADVRKETDKIVKLTRIDRSLTPPRPPKCEVSWGKSGSLDFPFTGVVTSLTQNFLLFNEDGVPVRAKLTISFTEFLGGEEDQRQNDPEFTTRTVRRGDSLSSLASEIYSNPTMWRVIAEANNLDDPRRLEIGKTLNVPKIK